MYRLFGLLCKALSPSLPPCSPFPFIDIFEPIRIANFIYLFISAASCAVPVVYGSTPLYAKDKNGKVVPWNPSGIISIFYFIFLL
jgi:hypothetical protein